jgi:hypothetical protein
MLDRLEIPHGDDRNAVRVDLDRALMVAFCHALESSTLPPMTVLSAMAEAFGSVYRQVADTHANGECTCGWKPSQTQDLAKLESVFRKTAMSLEPQKLSTMRVVGRA